MNILLTGGFGRVGSAIIDQLYSSSPHTFTFLDRRAPEDTELKKATHVEDITNYDRIRPAFDDQDVVIHLAGYPSTDGTWDEVLEENVIGTKNTLQASRDAGVRKFIYASSVHTVGMYEQEHAPDIYTSDHDQTVRESDPVRPDSFYGLSKLFCEDMGKYYIENNTFPKQFYALRLASVRNEEYDHPYGDAERGVVEGRWERDSVAYRNQVRRQKSMWLSRRDVAHMIDCCLRDETVDFGIFNTVSNNEHRWISIKRAKDQLGFDPQDNGSNWRSPP
jgi:nucleoside-diphosphate-sugar epimerase